MRSAQLLAGWKTRLPDPPDPIPSRAEKFPDIKNKFPAIPTTGNCRSVASTLLFFMGKLSNEFFGTAETTLRLPAFPQISL